jgi:23S rRNA pseudouridine2605 synthase
MSTASIISMDERVQKIIAQSGLCSRRKAEELIEAGRVQVNGHTIEIGAKADASTDEVTVDGQSLKIDQKVYYVLHKPKNYTTTNADPFAKHKVVDLVPRKIRVYPVGRLDKDATGLLLMTNDGTFANKVAHPSNGVSKTYVAILKTAINVNQIKKLAEGVVIDGRVIKSEVIQLEKNTVAITVHVGLHKIVKRLFKEVGSYVKHLHRTHIGNFALDVPEGDWRELEEQEKKLIFSKPEINKETFIQ